MAHEAAGGSLSGFKIRPRRRGHAPGPNDEPLRLESWGRQRALHHEHAHAFRWRRFPPRTAPRLRQGAELSAAESLCFHAPAHRLGGGQLRLIDGPHDRPGNGVSISQREWLMMNRKAALSIFLLAATS